MGLLRALNPWNWTKSFRGSEAQVKVVSYKELLRQNRQKNDLPTITIAGHAYHNKDFFDKSVIIDVPSLGQCSLSFIQGALIIDTDQAIDIRVEGYINPTSICIKTKGSVLMDMTQEAITSTTEINARQITLNSAIKALTKVGDAKTGSIKLTTTNARRCAININANIQATEVLLKTRNLNVRRDITTTILGIDVDNYRQEVNANLNVCSRQKYIDGKESLITMASGYIKANTMQVLGSICSEAELKINVLKRLRVRGKIRAQDLIITVGKLIAGFKGVIECINKLYIDADYVVNTGIITANEIRIEAKCIVNMLRGYIHGKKAIVLNALANFTLFGATLRGTNIMAACGISLNLLGLVRSFNYITECLLHLDLGASIPDLPDKLSSITGLQKAIAIFRIIVRQIYKPLGILLKIGLKLYSLVRRGQKLYENVTSPIPLSENSNRKSMLNSLNGLLHIRSMFFSVLAIAQERQFIHDCGNITSATIHNNPFVKESPLDFKESAKVVLRSAPALFAPVYVAESIVSVGAGYQLTGMKAIEGGMKYDRSKTHQLR